MKRRLLIALVVVLALAATASLVWANIGGLVSYWPFDEGSGTTATDVVNGNNGTIHGATYNSTDKAPVPGNVASLSFDGADDYVDIPDSDSLDTGTQFTIAAWFRTDDVDKIDPGTGSKTQTIIMYGWDPNDGKNNPLHIRDGKLYLAIRGYGGGYEDLVGVTPILNDTWYHAVLTYDGTTATLYLNGAEEVHQSATMNLNTDSRLTIGRYQNPLNYNLYFHFDGLIDEVGVWNRALSADEVAALSGSVHWLPPIALPDWTLNDRATLPIKFQLYDLNGNLLDTDVSPVLEVTKDGVVQVVPPLTFIVDDPENPYHYHANYKPGAEGNYTAAVFVAGVKVGEIDFAVTVPPVAYGKGKTK